MSDERTQRALAHGRRIRAVLEQPRLDPLRLSEQVALLLALKEGLLDELPPEHLGRFRELARAELCGTCQRVLARIDASHELSAEDRAQLLEALRAQAAGLLAEVGANTSPADAGAAAGAGPDPAGG